MPNFYITVGSIGHFTGDEPADTFTEEQLQVVGELVRASAEDILPVPEQYLDDDDETMNYYVQTEDEEDDPLVEIYITEAVEDTFRANGYRLVAHVSDTARYD